METPTRPPHLHRPFSDSRVHVQVSSDLSSTAEAAAAAQAQSEASQHARIKLRPSLQVYPTGRAPWSRPAPDSPKDVARDSDPHRADDDEGGIGRGVGGDGDGEDELDGVFEVAYAQTQEQMQMQTRALGRGPEPPLQLQTRQKRFWGGGGGGSGGRKGCSPLRVQHTQSMLPFPRSNASGGMGETGVDGADAGGSARKVGSPASDGQVGESAGVDADGVSAARRPVSVPSVPAAAAQGDLPWNH
jgi:hypothetical protein